MASSPASSLVIRSLHKPKTCQSSAETGTAALAVIPAKAGIHFNQSRFSMSDDLSQSTSPFSHGSLWTRLRGNRSRKCLEYKGFLAIPDSRFQHRIPLKAGDRMRTVRIREHPFGFCTWRRLARAECRSPSDRHPGDTRPGVRSPSRNPPPGVRFSLSSFMPARKRQEARYGPSSRIGRMSVPDYRPSRPGWIVVRFRVHSSGCLASRWRFRPVVRPQSALLAREPEGA